MPTTKITEIKDGITTEITEWRPDSYERNEVKQMKFYITEEKEVTENAYKWYAMQAGLIANQNEELPTKAPFIYIDIKGRRIIGRVEGY